MNNPGEQFPYTEEHLNNEASRALAAADLIRGGAEFVQDKSDRGSLLSPRLSVTADQVEKLKIGFEISFEHVEEKELKELDVENQSLARFFEAVKFVGDLYSYESLGGDAKELVSRGLSKNGLDKFFGPYPEVPNLNRALDFIEGLRSRNLFANPIDYKSEPFYEGLRDSLAEVSETAFGPKNKLPKGTLGLYDDKNKPMIVDGQDSIKKFAEWLENSLLILGQLQTLVEAIPKEAGLKALDTPVISKYFHECVESFVKGLKNVCVDGGVVRGVEYFPVVLYRTNLFQDSNIDPNFKRFLDDSLATTILPTGDYLSMEANKTLVLAFPEIQPGTFLRINKPVVLFYATKHQGGNKYNPIIQNSIGGVIYNKETDSFKG